MNRIYRTLWSAATQSWQAVPETAKTAGKKSKSSAGGVVASVALSLTLSGGAGAQSPPAINQLPTGGTVARGVATISQTATAQAAAMVVNQSSQRAVVNWNTFNLGSAASINFVQPNAQAVTLNRVNDSNPSQIFGRISANGQVFLTNANGVYFSPTSSVDVGAITATTHSISDDNFMSGKYVFERNGATGKVVNEGNITAALSGYVALLAPEVQNAGVVVARAGMVAMAAGEAITLSIDGAGSLAGITTTPSAIASLVENKLAVLAPDGQIILSAVALDKLQMGLIKNSGSLEANSLVNKGGKIVLEGDNIVMDRNSKIEAKGRTGGGVVLVGGDWQGSGDVRQATKVSMEAGATIDASATDNGDGGKVVLWSDVSNANTVTTVAGSIYANAGPNGGDGGQVETSGHAVVIDSPTVIASAKNGKSGLWLTDPADATIDATVAATYVASLNAGTSVVDSVTGNLTVSAPITTTANTGVGNLTLTATGTGTSPSTGDVNISANITLTGTSALQVNAVNNIYLGTSSAGKTITTAGGSVSFYSNTSNLTSVTAGAAIKLWTGSAIYSNGGAITLGGTSGSTTFAQGGTTNQLGVFLTGNNTLNSGGGTISMVGKGVPSALVSTSQLSGIEIDGGSTGTSINAGTGNIYLEGTNNSATVTNWPTATYYGVYTSGTAAIPVTFTSTGNVTIKGNQGTVVGLYNYGMRLVGTKFDNNGVGTGTTLIADWPQISDVTFNVNDLNFQPKTTGVTPKVDMGTSNTNTFNIGQSKTLNNLFAGSGNLKQSSPYTLTLASDNTNLYRGAISIDTGTTFALTGSGAMPYAGVSVYGTFDISGTTAATTSITSIYSGNGSIYLGSKNLAVTSQGNATFAGVISGSGNLSITAAISANGPLTLSGNNTYTGTTTINAGTTLNVGTGQTTTGGTLGSGLIYDYGNLVIYRSGALSLSTVAPNPGAITGTGNITIQGGSGSLTIDRDITLSGASSRIDLLARYSSGAGTGLFSDLILSNTVTTSDTGTINIFAGSPTSISTTSLSTMLAGAIGATQYKTYNATSTIALAGAVLGTRNFYYRDKPALSLAGVTVTKTYDRTTSTTGATFSGGSLSGTIDGDSFTGAISSGTFASANAGTGISVTVTPTLVFSTPSWTISAGTMTSYTVTGTIDKAPLTVTGTSVVSNKVYDGTATATITGGTLSGVVSGDTLTFTQAGTFSQAAVGTGLTVTVADTVTGTAAANYTLTQPTLAVATANITPKVLTVTGTSTATNKVYDGTTAAIITGGTLTGVITADAANVTLNKVGTFAQANVGTGIVVTAAETLSGTAAGNYTLTQPTLSTATANITPKALTVTGTSVAGKIYDGTTAATLSGGTLVGVISGDTVNLTQAGTFASASVGSRAVTANDSIDNSNYTLTQPSVGSATITAKALTVTGTTVTTKTYDRTTSATLSGGTLVGVVGSDNVTLATQVGTFASANAGTGIAVTVADTLGGTSAANYTLTQPTGVTGTITPKALTVTTTVTSKTYDGTTTATFGTGTLVGVISPDVVTLTQAGTFASANAGTGITVTTTDSLGGANAGNYTLTQPTLTGTITPKALTVTGTTAAGKTYDGTTAATLSGGTLVGVISGDTVNLTQAGTFASANVGTRAVTATDSIDNPNYTLTQPSVASATITAKALTVTGTTVASKTYDKTNTATLSGGTLVGVVSGDTVTLATQVGTFASVNVGTGIAVTAADTLGGASAGNYTLTQPTGLTGSITAKALTVTGTTVATKTYDGTTTATLSGGTLVTGGVLSGDTVTLATQTGTFASANAGTGIVVTAADTLGGASAGNYTLTQPALTGTINKASATVTASSSSVTYTGFAQSVNGFTATGLVNSETVAVLTGVSTSGGTGTNAGTYASIASGTAANYNLTFVNGALTINKANATVTANGGTTTYNGAAQSVSGFTVTGLVNSEAPSVLTNVTAGVTATNAGTYTVTPSGTDTNYNLSFVNGTFTIGKANATVTANSSTVTYTGAAQSVTGFTATGLLNGQTTTVLTGVSISGGTGTNVGTYTATASGTDTNYTLTFVPGAITINKAHLTVTANNASKTYGAANPTLSATVSGFVGGQTLGTSGVTGAGTATTTATALTGAGTATITAGVGTLAATNYDFTNLVDGTLTISKANATVTASSSSVTYTGLAQSVNGFTATGLVNSETAAVLTGVTAGATGTNAGTYASIASGTAANYNLTFVNGALTINKANATVTANGGTTTYNGAAQSVSGFTVTGLVNSEAPSVLTGVTAGVTATNAGTYTSTASGTDNNYNLSFVNGTFTINKAPLSVSLTGQTKVYDGTTNATMANGSLTLTGFMSGEGATLSQTQGTYNSANVLTATSVTASLAAGNYTASNGTLLSNYVLPTSATGTGSITPARLSATGTKTYDGLVAFDATGLTVSGVNGETFAATGSLTMSSKNVQTNQALTSIAGLSLSGNSGALTSNYVALTTSDTQVSVTPRAVNLSAPAASKTYDSTTLYQVSAAELTTLSNQLVGGDRVTAAEVVYATKDAGTSKRVILNNVTINDDNGGNNYTVAKLDVTTGAISKAPLTVSVVSDARFVGLSDTAGYAGVVYNGFVGGETASAVTAGTIARSNSGVNGAGQYTGVLQASGWQSGNYNISYNAGDYTIVGAHTLLVTVPTASTTYGTAATYTPTAKYLDSVNNTIVTLTPTVTGNALTVSDGAGGQASFAITAANATLSGAGNVQAGGYNLVASNVVKTGNNFQNLVMTGGLTVTPKVLNNNLGVQAITKVYDGSASISNLGLSFNQPLAGVASGDTVSLVGSGSFDDRHVATNKTVNLSLGLLGADAANYALATPSFSTNTGSITQLASVTYTGATNGNWSDFSNWAGGAMPDRNNVAQVVIPAGKTVLYSSDQVGTIGSTLAVDGAIRFTSSNAFTLANTVSGTGDLQQRGNGMLTVSGTNTNFSGNLDIGSYQATLSNAQALGAAGHVVSSGGQLSVASGLTLAALHADGALTVDTAIKTTSDQVYNGALTFLSSGTTQAPNFVSTAGDVDFMSTVSAGSGAMTAQRALVVSAPQGSVLINDQIGRMVKNLSFSTYLSTGLLDTSPYTMTVVSPSIKLYGDVTTFESQTYDGAVRVGNNTHNGNTRLLVSVDPSITFKGTVDDADPTGKVNGLDVRAISLAALAANAPVPTITFENNVGSTSPLASLRLAAGTQSTVAGALVTDIKTDDTSRRDTNYKGDIVLKGDLTVDNAPEMIAEQLLVPNASQTLTWFNGTPDFKLRLPVSGTSSVLPTNFHLNGPGGMGGGNGGGNNNNANNTDPDEGGRQWRMAHNTQENAKQVRANEAAMKAMDAPTGRLVADVQVGNETSVLPVAATPATNSSHVQAQTVNVTSSGAFVQVREFAPQTLSAQQAFVYQLPADMFVHSRENESIKLSASLSNGANLPRWVKFSAKTRSFSGEAPKHVKSLDVKVTATDRQGKRASTRIRLVFTHGSGS